MAGVGDPLADIGWMELLWLQPVGITSRPSSPAIDELHRPLHRRQAESSPPTASGTRALNAYKMAVICLIGSMLYAAGSSTDERFAMNALGIPLLTQLGLGALGVTEKLDDGPVQAR